MMAQEGEKRTFRERLLPHGAKDACASGPLTGKDTFQASETGPRNFILVIL